MAEYKLPNRNDVRISSLSPELKTILPIPLPISHRLMDWGYLIGPVVEELTQVQMEIGGFFASDTASDFALRDFIVPKELELATGNISFAENYDACAREFNDRNALKATKYEIASTFHVHPWNIKPDHSTQDNAELIKLVNKMALTNRRVVIRPLDLIASKIKKECGNSDYVLKGDEISDAIVRFVYPNDDAFYAILKEFGISPDIAGFNKPAFLERLLDSIGRETKEPKVYNFTASLVFNNYGDGPFVIMGVEEKTIITNTYKYLTIPNVPLEIIEKDLNLPSVDDVVNLVMSRVKMSPAMRKRALAIIKNGDKTPEAGAELAKPDQESISVPLEPTADTNQEANVQPAAIEVPSPLEVKAANKPIHTTVYRPETAAQAEKKPIVEKGSYEAFSIRELVDAFLGSVMAYTSRYKSEDCLYGQHLAKLVDTMSIQFQPTTVEQLIHHSGRLKKDVDQEEPKAPSLSYVTFLATDVSKFLSSSMNLNLRRFMLDFIDAQNKEKNTVLENYYAYVFGDALKYQPLIRDGTKAEAQKPLEDLIEKSAGANNAPNQINGGTINANATTNTPEVSSPVATEESIAAKANAPDIAPTLKEGPSNGK